MITFKMKHILILLCITFLTACAGPSEVVLGEARSEWDFDHQLQFKETKYDDLNYKLEVIDNKQVNFERLAAFLLRQSYLICGGNGYQLTMVKGIKSFDFNRASPNYIVPNLTAKLKCPLRA